MCGIYGMMSLTGEPLRHPEIMEAMGRALRHRGPDTSGQVVMAQGAMGTQRLRIIDPTPAADQPFHQPEGCLFLVCNGEIYNAGELRDRYGAPGPRSRSDIEPLLPLLVNEGPDALAAVEGMFAVAAWLPRKNTLILARDRAGEKPLFYSIADGEVWFASEVQALLHHPRSDRSVDQDALLDYLTLGFVRQPRTLFAGIRKVPASGFMTFEVGHREPKFNPFAEVSTVTAASGQPDADLVADLLEAAVRQQLSADVPIGAFLSGGLDSGLVSSIASNRTGNRLTTFTLKFEDASFDESRYGRRLADSLGSRHIEVAATPVALRDALDTVTRRVAEPVADPAILPTYLLARRAKDSVGVVLSGEGADELFGGYPTYLGHELAGRYGVLPRSLRRLTETVAGRAAASHRRVPAAYLVHRFARHASRDWVTRHLCWFGTGLLDYLGPNDRENMVESVRALASSNDPLTGAMTLDYLGYLREGLLVKLDRGTMLSGLEARAPFLSPRLSAFATQLPSRRKIHLLTTKRILKEVARDALPGWVARRRKQGLSVPIAKWLNGGLREEADRLLSPERLENQGVLSELPIRQLLREHRTGRANHARPLWAVIMLQYWRENWTPGAT